MLEMMSGFGMTLFFVLSGFVIHWNYSDSISSKVGLWNFFVARFARLYPLYFVFLSADLLTHYGIHHLSSHRALALPFYLTLTQSWFYIPIDGNSLIYQYGLAPSVSWSISTEWFFYFVFPLICLALIFLKTPKRIATAAVIFCVLALSALTLMNLHIGEIFSYGQKEYGPIGSNLQDGLYRWIAYFCPYVRVMEFMLGCFVSLLIKRMPKADDREQKVGLWLACGAIASTVFLQWEMFGREHPMALIQQLHQNFGFAPVCAVLIFCCARYQNMVTGLLSLPRVVLLGEASYSMYLSHALIISAFATQAPQITERSVWLTAAILLALTLASVLGASLVLWNAIEMPARRAIRKWFTVVPDMQSDESHKLNNFSPEAVQ